MSENPYPVADGSNGPKLENGPTQPAIFEEQDINESEKKANFDGSLLNPDHVEAPFEGPKLTDSEEKSGVSGNRVDDKKVEAPFEGDTVNASEVKAGLTDAPAATDYPVDGNIDEVLAWVGDDSAKAQKALDAENATDKPRATLVKQLKAAL